MKSQIERMKCICTWHLSIQWPFFFILWYLSSNWYFCISPFSVLLFFIQHLFLFSYFQQFEIWKLPIRTFSVSKLSPFYSVFHSSLLCLSLPSFSAFLSSSLFHFFFSSHFLLFLISFLLLVFISSFPLLSSFPSLPLSFILLVFLSSL